MLKPARTRSRLIDGIIAILEGTINDIRKHGVNNTEAAIREYQDTIKILKNLPSTNCKGCRWKNKKCSQCARNFQRLKDYYQSSKESTTNQVRNQLPIK